MDELTLRSAATCRDEMAPDVPDPGKWNRSLYKIRRRRTVRSHRYSLVAHPEFAAEVDIARAEYVARGDYPAVSYDAAAQGSFGGGTGF